MYGGWTIHRGVFISFWPSKKVSHWSVQPHSGTSWAASNNGLIENLRHCMLISHFVIQETLVKCQRGLWKSLVNICWGLMIASLQDNFAQNCKTLETNGIHQNNQLQMLTWCTKTVTMNLNTARIICLSRVIHVKLVLSAAARHCWDWISSQMPNDQHD